MKRGQVTLFIILGLILIITIGTVIYFVGIEAQKPWRAAPKVPIDARPVYDMIHDCTKDALKQGLILQGLQGGYVDIPSFILNNPDSYLSADPMDVIKIPYWYYETENRIPSYPLMQIQLGKYVKEQIMQCVDFKGFEPKQRVQALEKEPDVLITFADQEVVAEVKWPLKILTYERESVFSEYFAVQELKYKEMYEKAVKILEQENKQEWLEKMTIDFMSADQKIPLGGMESSCKQSKWAISDIEKRFKEALFYLIPMIRIENTPQLKPLASERVYAKLKKEGQELRDELIEGKTEVDFPTDIPADTYEINKMTFDPDLSETDLKIGFVYDPSKLLLNILPRDGKWLKSTVAKGSKEFISFFCMNQWHFTYDVIYPVKVVLKDEEAFDNEGYVFEYVFPVLINDNAPERVDFGIRKFEPMYIGTGFCEDLGEEEVTVKVLGFEPYTPMALEQENVNITLSCMNIDCDIGTTTPQPDGEIKLITKIPQGCGNPKVIAKKQGYLETEQWLTDSGAELVMKKLYALKPEFVIHPYQSVLNQWQTSQNRFRLNEKEKITIMLKDKNSNFEQNKIYPSDDDIELVLDDTVYELEIYFTIGDALVGGYKNKNFAVNFDDLLGKEKIQFNIIEYRPNPITGDELAKMMAFLDKGEYAGQESYQTALKPLLT